MATAQRKARLESLLREEIATAVQRSIDDPRCGFVTITRVEMTGDLHQVTAYFSVLGTPAEQARAARVLDRLRPGIQQAYAKVVRTRLLPILHFRPDIAEAKRFDIDALIHKARQSDTDGGTRPEPPVSGGTAAAT